MALFDLRCKDCEKEFTAIVSFSKLAGEKCPHCDSQNHERVYKAHFTGPVNTSSSGGSSIPTSGFS